MTNTAELLPDISELQREVERLKAENEELRWLSKAQHVKVESCHDCVLVDLPAAHFGEVRIMRNGETIMSFEDDKVVLSKQLQIEEK